MIKKAITAYPAVRSYLLSAISLVLICSTLCFAQPLSSTELINNAKLYDNKTVTYAGEAIGDVMVRGDNAWINLADGNNAIGVWIDKNLVKDINYTGSYKFKGDLVEITGVFHRACQQHGGDLDIHAQGLRKINPGRQVNQVTNSAKVNLAYILLGVLTLVWILKQLKLK